MDNIKEQSDSLLISESDQQMLLSNNLSDLLAGDYFQKFKLDQNLYEQSMTMSKLSMTEKDRTFEDNNNNTYIKMVTNAERLTSEIMKNQVLENKIQKLEEQLNTCLQHNQVQQEQIESQQSIIQQKEEKIKNLIKNHEIEKLLNSQLMKKIQEQNIKIKNYEKQFVSQHYQTAKYHKQDVQNSFSQTFPKGMYASGDKYNLNIGTDNSSNKDTSDVKSCSSQQRNQQSQQQNNHKQKQYSDKSHNHDPKLIQFETLSIKKDIWSPNKFRVNNSNLEKRIEATLKQIKQIKVQFQNFK